ncbi:hypothetical protein IG611_01710 [Pectobacterium sp. A535-S3-A17]|uniref:hypothetical protein n=1 Tax=Pectobacterium quasiaquaticum TaxID=2774015 RepID=UPI0018761070|nr:hypothetical protein [Pectobacterium quasiaquaticum]MBE5213248.1 hypothetical protein [Pectobacterium quasiaquaticum]MBE5224102.1 hypothetical protein [Pectobacterium quasiaquaticum]
MKETGIIFNSDMVRATLSGEKTQTRRIMKIQPPKRENFPGSSFGLCRAVHPDSKMFSLNQYDRLPKHPTDWDLDGSVGVARNAGFPMTYRCPFGQVGDRLWVRETWSLLGNEDACTIDWNDNLVKGGGVDAARIYRASCEQKPGDYGLWSIPDDADWKPHTDDMKFEGAWTPSIHMPRWASRIILEITDVRVERLNDISEQDCWAEGIDEIDGRFENVEIIDMAVKLGCCIEDAKPMFALLWQSIYGAESWSANPWVWAVSFKRIEGV